MVSSTDIKIISVVCLSQAGDFSSEYTRNGLSVGLCLDPWRARIALPDFLAGFRGRERREGKGKDGKGKARMDGKGEWMTSRSTHTWMPPPCIWNPGSAPGCNLCMCACRRHQVQSRTAAGHYWWWISTVVTSVNIICVTATRVVIEGPVIKILSLFMFLLL